MSQEVVAAQPHLPIVQVSSKTIVAIRYAISLLPRLLYDLLDVATSIILLSRTGSARMVRSKTFVVSFVVFTVYALPSRLGKLLHWLQFISEPFTLRGFPLFHLGRRFKSTSSCAREDVGVGCCDIGL